MSKYNNLHQAKKTKNDEFMTQLEDVEKECCHYVHHFRDKKILCNCNDQKYTAFKDYFKINYKTLQLRELICTSFEKDGHGELYRYDGENEHISQMTGNGGFNTPEGIELIKEADIIVTNPPFSLWKDFVATLEEYGKKYLILGNMNAITYKGIFPLIKENKLWLGCSLHATKCHFIVSDDYEYPNVFIDKDRKKKAKVNNAVWFTNLDHNKCHKPLDLHKHYTPEEYPKYDNYDVINVDRVCDIPMDYDGVMGVPITFLDKYCPDQFEIIGICGDVWCYGDFECRTIINGKVKYARILIKQETKWIR